jgi:tRNA A-37 threonylcarbamoyl transferase component Bud32
MPEGDSRITLLREISRSTIATVWEAYDSGLDRKVLVKAISPQFARDQDIRVRFEREARAIARLSHPNVVQIYDLRTSGDDLSLVLEFVDGGSLGRLLRERGSLPADMAVTFAAAILSGLEQAHAHSIVHRDLKPENVLVSKTGEVKITDFGLATLRDQPSVTQEGEILGTPSYMAPEQAAGGEISPATDVFAVGLILFEMLTGQRFFDGTSLAQILLKVQNYSEPGLHRFREQIPENIQPVLARMLERTPSERFGNAVEARAALTEAQIGALLPRTLIADYLSGEPIRRPQPKAVAGVKAVKWSVRRILVMALMAVAILAGAGLLSYFGFFARPRSESEKPVAAQKDTLALIPVQPSPRDTSAPVTPPGESGAEPQHKPRRESEPGVVVPPSHLDTTSPQPRDTTKRTVAEPTGPGFVDISCRPWAQVYVSDSLVGTTPTVSRLELPPGNHTIVLLNPEIRHPVARNVVVRSGQTTEMRINLYDYVARIRIASVKPWADVYINNAFEVRTPSSKLIIKPLGTYTITLKNPDYPPYDTTVTFREGDPVHEIRVDLAHR